MSSYVVMSKYDYEICDMVIVHQMMSHDDLFAALKYMQDKNKDQRRMYSDDHPMNTHPTEVLGAYLGPRPRLKNWSDWAIMAKNS